MAQKEKQTTQLVTPLVTGLAAAVATLCIVQYYRVLQPDAVPNTCNVPAHGADSSYQYEEYTVQKGDTLSSIAQEELGNKTRVQELIVLNEERLPTLKRNPEWVEPGWTLLLPPKEFEITEHELAELRGYVHMVAADRVIISTTQNLEQQTHIYITSKSQFVKAGDIITKESVQPGDCISAVVRTEGSTPNAIQVLEVTNADFQKL